MDFITIEVEKNEERLLNIGKCTKLQHLFGYHRLVQPSNKTLQRLTDTTPEDSALQTTI